MENPAKQVEVQNLLSLADDLVGILKNKKNGDVLVQSLEDAKMLQFSCRSDTNEIQRLLQDYEKKFQASKEKIENFKDEVLDAKLENLQQEVEGKLQEEHLLREELRAISYELVGLECQRVAIEARKEKFKITEKDLQRAHLLKFCRDELSMCASVKQIIPDLADETKVSGYIVERNKKKVEKFEFQRSESSLDICNKLWEMA